MAVGIALIRGINVGGKNLLPMAVLRALCEKAGFADVRTHIQSGNVVFRAGAGAMKKAARMIEDAIEAKCKFRPSVSVRTVEELRVIAAKKPFGGGALDPDKLLVMFLVGDPPAGAAAAIRAIKADPERLALDGRELFMYFPVGVGASKLPMAKCERAVGVPGTCRNWNTVHKVLAMAEEQEGAAKPR